MMSEQQLIETLYQISAIKFGHFTLKSGATSSIYLDLRRIISYPALLREVATRIWEKVATCHFDLICGVPYTALPIATCLSLEHNVPLVMRRKEKKSYGTKQQIEGAYQPGQTCLIIEDLITTGSSILETAAELASAGLKITDAGALIDRQQGGPENLAQQHYTAHTVMSLKQILQTLLHSSLVTEAERIIIHGLIK